MTNRVFNNRVCKMFPIAFAVLTATVCLPIAQAQDAQPDAPVQAKPKEPTMLDTLNWIKGKFENNLPIQNTTAAAQKIEVNWTEDLGVMTIRVQYYADASRTRTFHYFEIFEIRLSELDMTKMENDKAAFKKSVLLSPVRNRRVDERDGDKNTVTDDVDQRFTFHTETMATRISTAFRHAHKLAVLALEESGAKDPNEPF